MRLQHWLTTIVCFFTLIAGARTSHGQGFPGAQPIPTHPAMAGGYDGPPGYQEASFGSAGPPGVVPHYSTVLSPEAVAGGLPPGALPHPRVSPFEHRFSQHSMEDGLWMHEVNDSPRQYFGGISAMLFRLRKPERALFGDPAFRTLADAMNPPVTIGQPYGNDHVFDKNFKTEGIRLHWGFNDADGTGLEAVAWWATDVTHQFKLGQDADASDPAAAIEFPPAIPVANGGAGDVIVLDRLFRMRYSAEAVNAQVDRVFAPVWKTEGIKLRPSAGIRYLFLRERLAFDGIAGGPPYYTAFLDTNTRSHMVGPQLGLQTEIGGESFRIVAVTRVVLFANIERVRMEGDNFGSPAQVALGTINSFSQTVSSSHVSPAFEQTIHMEANLIQFIPILNRYRLLQNARIRGGFTFFNVAEVARPGRAVRFRGMPQQPEVKSDRSKWSFTAWDIGLIFRY